MSDIQVDSGRRGGRAARRAQRAAPLPQNQRPVWPGMEGGNYKALKDEDIQKIHHAVLDVLANIGLADAIPTCIEACTAAGAEYNDKGRLTFLALAGRGHHRQGGAAVRALWPGAAPRHGALGQEGLFRHRRCGRAYRRSHDRRVSRVAICRTSTTSPASSMRWSISTSSSAPWCRAICPIRAEMDINTCYASVMGTTKHVGSSWVAPEHLEASLPDAACRSPAARTSGARGRSSASRTASSCRR